MAEETRIIRIVVDSSKAVDGSASATRALEKMERAQAATASSLDRMEQALGRVGGYLKAQLALMVADVASRLLSMAKGALDAAANMDELAEQVGLTARGLQAMQFAAVQSNVKLEQLEGGLGKFAQKMGEATEGSKEMIEALDRIGVKNLDAAGKLRTTEALMTDVAAAILKIEDPARRSAAMVDFFGKTGAKMLPMLKEMAGGFDDMAAKAKAAGAMISAEAIAKLDKLGDASERSQLKMRALFAENAAGPLTDVIDFITRKMENLSKIVKGLSVDISSLLAIVANPGLLVGRVLASTPQEKLASDLASARGEASAAWDNLNVAQTDRDKARMMSAYAKAQQRVASLEQQQGVLAVSGKADYRASDPDGVGVVVAARGGAKLSTIKGAGGGQDDAIAKLNRDTARELDAANAYAEASERGARAVADLEIHFKALKAAQDAYGNTADRNSGQVAALTARIEEQMKAAERLKNLKDFNLGTEELERANELLAAENGLINANVEDRARELALIKIKHDVQSKGLDENNSAEKAAIERRHTAIEQNERLKAQGEELRKANELWTAPLKSALESIQSTAADAFEGMLNSGKFSFEALGDVFRKIVTRMIAEFMALATIRPVMNVVVQAVNGSGLVSSGTANQLGFGGGGGGGGLLDMFSGLFTGSQGAGGGNISGFGAGGGPLGPSGGAMASQGGFFSPASGLQMGSFGMGNLSGALGIGMGALSLATNKKPTTASTIGGIGQMVGGGLMMIPTPWTMAAGAVISLASSILPSLFGGEEYKWDPLAGANVQFNPGAGGYTSNATQQLGGKSIAGQFSGVGSTLDAFFNRAGGLTNPGNAFGAAIWNNQREGTTSTYEISPTQGSHQLTYDESGDPAAAVDRMIAKVFYNSIQNNAAMKASPTLRTAFSNREPGSTAEIAGLFDLIDAYDQLGKETTAAEKALKAIDESFASLTAGAQAWGLSMAPITAELEKQRKAYAEDFLHTIDSVLDPVGTALDDFAKEREAGMKEWAYINDNVKEVVIAQAKVEEYYAKKEAALKEQLYGGAVAQLEDAIKRLMPGGSLSNLDPAGTLAGMTASYRATYGQAASGDAAAIARLAGEGTSLAEYSKSYFAGSPEYNALRDEILANFQTIQAAIQSPTGSSTPLNTNDPGIQTLVQQNQILQQTVQTLVESDKRKSEEVTRLTNLLSRYLTNGQRAA